jgi:peptidoglycan/xylan/chitin deacetylase (PgdA/CDA1 family)
VPRPKIGTVPYRVSIRACNIPGKVALTFDDGPYIYTSDLLDILKARGVKATFFLVGNNGGKGQINDPKTGYPSLIRRMYNEGHQIGSHTWSHQDLSTLTQRQRYDQIIKNEIALSDILGFFPTYLRPPYMSCNADCLTDLRDLGYHVANYNIDTLDWQENYPNSQHIFQSALQSGNPKTNSFISIAHDIHSRTVHDFVPFMIDHLKAQGYTTALYGECLDDPPSNWYRYPSIASSTTASISHLSSNTHSTSQAATPTVAQGGERAFGSRTGNGTSTTQGIKGTAVGMVSNSPKSEGVKGYGPALGLWAIVGSHLMGIMASCP